MKKLLFCLALLFSTGVVFAAPNASVTPSITNSNTDAERVAPLCIFYDATASTDVATTAYPFEDLLGRWNFGDPYAGNHTNGSNTTRSKNRATGLVAGHCYEVPGSYSWSYTLSNGTTTDSEIGGVTVTDPNTVFALNTICLSTGTATAGSGGCPVGAYTASNVTDVKTTINTGNLLTTGCGGSGCKRFMFKAGESFNTTTSVNINVAGPGIFTSYGVGASPVIFNAGASNNSLLNIGNSSNTDTKGWRFNNLVLDGNGGTGSGNAGVSMNSGTSSFITFINMTFQKNFYGLTASVSNLDFYNQSLQTTNDETIADAATVIPLTTTSGGNRAIQIGDRISISRPTDSVLNRSIDFYSTLTAINPGVSVTIADPLDEAWGQTGRTVTIWPQASPVQPMWDHVFIVYSNLISSNGTVDSGSNTIYFASDRFGFIGNYVNPTYNGAAGGEHGVRTMRTNKAVYSNNTVEGVNATKASFTLRSINYEGTPTLAYGSQTQYVILQDNLAIGGGGSGCCGPNNQTSSGRSRHVVIERNWIKGDDSTYLALSTQSQYVSIRNNIIDGSLGLDTWSAGIAIANGEDYWVPIPERVHIFNNTLFTSRQSVSGYGSFIAMRVGTELSPQTPLINASIKNNIFYAPNEGDVLPKAIILWVGNTWTISESNNPLPAMTSGDSSSQAMVDDNPEFSGPMPSANSPMASVRGFIPSNVNNVYSSNGGTDVGVPKAILDYDFFGCRSATGKIRRGVAVASGDTICDEAITRLPIGL